jgi:hypothetical protein
VGRGVGGFSAKPKLDICRIERTTLSHTLLPSFDQTSRWINATEFKGIGRRRSSEKDTYESELKEHTDPS